MVRRWLIAGGALLVGGAITASLLIFANPSRDAVAIFVAARDVPAATQLTAGAVALAWLPVEHRSLVFTRADAARLYSLVATHDLVAGQVIQRSDAAPAPATPDRRLVFVPIKDVPSMPAGSRVDLLAIVDAPGHVTVEPFALGVEVRESTAGGMILVVPSRQAPAFVYAASAMHLVAVVAEPGAAGGQEAPVSSPDQAMQIASEP